MRVPMFNISLAQWSLHRTLLGAEPGGIDWARLEHDLGTDPNNAIRGDMDHLDFITAARRDYDIDAVEYVNTFFFGRAQDQAYLNEMKDRADSEGVQSLLIMCDFEGRPGDPDRTAAQQAVENHYKWIEAAQVTVASRHASNWPSIAKRVVPRSVMVVTPQLRASRA